MNKNICIITSTRADYSLLKPLIALFNNDSKCNLQLIATGTHLSAEFGNTYKAIEEDGFEITEKINIICDDTKQGVGNSMGLAAIGFSSAYKRLQPDLIILLGDRYEIFVAAATATVFNIPIAHIHGGEETTGAIDNAFRHSITNMSTLHFTASQEYRQRVIQIRNSSENVYFTGSLAVDSVKSIELLSKQETEERLGMPLNKSILFTYHPETLSALSIEEQCEEVFCALEELVKDFYIVMTKSNADAGGTYINKLIDEFAERYKGNAIARASLGQLLYYSAMKYCSLVLGNSSSGVLETPIFKAPTVNIGNRQNGRIMAENIVCAECSSPAIINAVNSALEINTEFVINPFEKDSASESIYNILLKHLEN